MDDYNNFDTRQIIREIMQNQINKQTNNTQKLKAPLQIFRQRLAQMSIKNAINRITKEQQFHDQYNAKQIQQNFDKQLNSMSTFQNISTSFGDNSSVTRGSFSKDGKLYGTVGASGEGQIWSTQNENSEQFCTSLTSLIGSTSKLTDIAFSPRLGQIPQYAPNIITSNIQGQIHLWTFSRNLAQQKNITLKLHQDRINRILYDINGQYFFTASYDQTWSALDANRASKIFTQKGHPKQIHALALHPDNSLIFTGDLGGNGMLWDLRTGRGIMQLSQTNSILCASFNSNGYQLAISGKNNIIDVMDLRRRSLFKSIPAHLKLVSDLFYDPSGRFLISVSHDNSIKLWHGLSYNTLIDEDMKQSTKITSVSFSNDKIATTMIDRKWSLWKLKELDRIKQQAIQQ